MKPDLSRESERKATIHAYFIIISLILFITVGCDGGETTSKESPSGAPVTRKIFVTNSIGENVAIFDAEASGNVRPIRRIGSNSGLARPRGIFVDSVNNEIFVTNNANNSVTVYSSEEITSEDVQPLRVIEGSNTGLLLPVGLFVDTTNNLLFVLNFDSITVFGRTDQGNISPIRTIQGDKTKIFLLDGLFVDTENNEIYVAGLDFISFEGVIHVFQATDNGDIPPKRTIEISELTDEGFPFVPESIFVDPENDELYVVDFGVSLAGPELPIVPFVGVNLFPVQKTFDSTIKVYGRTDQGNSAPLRKIRGPNSGLANPMAISVDDENDEILVANGFNNTITVYHRNDNGDVRPLRTLLIEDANNSGVRNRRGSFISAFLDHENDQIFIANANNTILVYRKVAKGSEAPLRVIGHRTGLLEPKWIFVDTRDQEILVSNFFSQQITIHSIDDKGNKPPLRTIPQGEFLTEGIFLDVVNDETFVANVFPNISGVTPDTDTITVYSNESGIELRNIAGLNTGLSNPKGIFVDTLNSEIFVANSGTDSITVYGQTDEGNVHPIRNIGGENTRLSTPTGIFVDTLHNEVFVANSGNNSITVYANARTATGDITPIRILEGENTGLSFNNELIFSAGIFVDVPNSEMFVTNYENNSITVFDREASNDEKPIRTIKGQDTGLSGPVGIFVAESP